MPFQYYGLPQEQRPDIYQRPQQRQQQQQQQMPSPMQAFDIYQQFAGGDGGGGIMEMFGGGGAGAGSGGGGIAVGEGAAWSSAMGEAGGGSLGAFDALGGTAAGGTGGGAGAGAGGAGGTGGGAWASAGPWALLAAAIVGKAEHTRKKSGVSYEDQLKNISLAPQKDFDEWGLEKYTPLGGGEVYKSTFDLATFDLSNWWEGATAPFKEIF